MIDIEDNWEEVGRFFDELVGKCAEVEKWGFHTGYRLSNAPDELPILYVSEKPLPEDLYNEHTEPIAFTYEGHWRWTQREEQRLFNSYKTQSIETLLILFPDRTLEAIKAKAWALGLCKWKPWSESEELLLRKLTIEKASKDQYLISLPDRSWEAIKDKRRRLHLPRVGSWFNNKEDELLIGLKKLGYSYREISTFFENRTSRSLRNRYNRIRGIKK